MLGEYSTFMYICESVRCTVDCECSTYKNDDGDNDFGDDNSSEEDEAVFGGATKTIVAES